MMNETSRYKSIGWGSTGMENYWQFLITNFERDVAFNYSFKMDTQAWNHSTLQF